jgi:hypothetical protein
MASSAALARTASLPGGDITAWLREKFPELPADDFVDASYSCALVRSILLQGRLYVTCSGLAFYAKIFGRVTKEYVSYASLRCVRKRRSGFVANAIKLEFLDDAVSPMVFGSLNRRERAIALITLKLCAANPLAVRGNDAEEDGSEFDTDVGFPLDESGFRSKSVPSRVAVGSALRLSSPVDAGGVSGGAVVGGLERAATYGGGRLRNRDSSLPPLPRRMQSVGSGGVPVVDDFVPEPQAAAGLVPAPPQAAPVRTPMWKVDGDVVDRVAGKAHSSKVEQARRVLNAPVEAVFDILFEGGWMLEVHGKNGNTELSNTPWSRGDDGYMTRTMRFSRALGYRIGPKATRVVETHRYSFTRAGGAVVEWSGHNLDVPMGDAFRVESYVELSPESAGVATLVVASVAVHFARNTMLRGKIESGALAETKETMMRLLDLAEHKVADSVAESAPALALNGRSDSSLNKRSSDNLGSLCLVAPVSPTKKYRTELLPRSGAGAQAREWRGVCATAESGPPEVPLLAAPLLSSSASSAVAASSVVADSGAPMAAGPRFVVEQSDTMLLRTMTVLLLAVIAVLLVVCIVLLSRLQVDLVRLERLAALRLEQAAPAPPAGEVDAVCAAAVAAAAAAAP